MYSTYTQTYLKDKWFTFSFIHCWMFVFFFFEWTRLIILLAGHYSFHHHMLITCAYTQQSDEYYTLYIFELKFFLFIWITCCCWHFCRMFTMLWGWLALFFVIWWYYLIIFHFFVFVLRSPQSINETLPPSVPVETEREEEFECMTCWMFCRDRRRTALSIFFSFSFRRRQRRTVMRTESQKIVWHVTNERACCLPTQICTDGTHDHQPSTASPLLLLLPCCCNNNM
jgi:hypothetical protein